ncbi:expressed unknown protein [Seminavis robusta]|uniref:O-fucosyltransferase family protein n=1 Tax=Seminavis robusta TaxID=568900 RepID=A0A9N8DV40_9STRA|nr:expressed unknown protein [Seminavis robusta]|eukprot:Sro393_g133570.1 n/a (432) ;mRNA; r:19778-21073
MSCRPSRQGVVVVVIGVAILVVIFQFLQDAKNIDEADASETKAKDSTTATVASSLPLSKNTSSSTIDFSWRKSSRLPNWMKDYFDWHVQERARLDANPLEWESFRFLVMRCYKGDNCGGTADRLKSLPLLVLLAAESKRLLLLKWGNPFDLEEFLMPHELNWTVPSEMRHVLASSTVPRRKPPTTVQKLEKFLYANHTIVGAKLQIPSAFYDTDKWKQSPLTTSITSTRTQSTVTNSDEDSRMLFHDLWKILFQPSAPVAEMIQHELKAISSTLNIQLTPGTYIAAHLRAKYPGEPYRDAQERNNPEKEQILQHEVTQALQCASHLKPKVPIYFAADATQATEFVQQQYHHPTNKRHIATLQSQRASEVHLAFAKLDDPTGYFPIFVDLWILGNADCVSYGRGGFGQLASLMSYNASCQQIRSRSSCEWKD